MSKRTVIYYSDELGDEFSGARIKAKRIDRNYVYERGSIAGFFWYRIVALPLAFLYTKLVLRQKTVGREKLKGYRGSGMFIYGNHTQEIGDPLIPNIFCFPKRVYFIVHPDNVSIPALGRITPYLGAIPLPDDGGARRRFITCLDRRIAQKSAIVIYPEAHIWPFYTKIRPFTDKSFGYPARSGAPVFCFTNTYKRRGGSGRAGIVTYIDGPFLPDMTLPPKKRRALLRDLVYSAMCARAELSDIEVIKYVRLPNNDSNDHGGGSGGGI